MVQITLSRLLAIEDDDSMLQHRCADTGLLTWPLLRNQFLRALTASLYYPGTAVIGPPPPGRYRRALAALPKTLWHNARHWNELQGDILIMASGAGHFRRNGRSFNRIADYFALEASRDAVKIEGLMDWRIPRDPGVSRTGYYLPWQGTIDLLGKWRQRSRHARAAAELLDYARARALEILGLRIEDSQAAYLHALVTAKLARLPGMLATYRRLLHKTRAKLILLEQGCYSDLGVFNFVAREMKIRVAEPQHGLVSSSHDAYCYAPALRASAEFRRYLPHDFLGYGEWWNRQINVPIRKFVIGHPHYTEQLRVLERVSHDKRDLLLLSDGFEFDKYLELAKELQTRVGTSHRVLLRPHPLERERVVARFTDGNAGGVAIDLGLDIYAALCSASAVLGELSTGLFEGIGLADRIFIWATPKSLFSCPEHPFNSFRDARELAELVLSPDRPRTDVPVESIWAPGWRKNFRDYLDMALQGPPTEEPVT